MKILGINASHVATACVLIDGRLVSSVSEERLSRVKNQAGLPILATKEALRIAGVAPQEIDLTVFGYKDPKVNTEFAAVPDIPEFVRTERKSNSWEKILKIAWELKEEILVKLPWSRNLYFPLISFFYSIFIDPRAEKKLLKDIEEKLGISKERVIRIDHHLAHAYSTYFSAPDYWKKEMLILTLDAMGDETCATVSIGRKGKLRRISKTSAGNSIGDLYAFITAYLGMKMGEHEYKVMGLGPYANEKYVEKVYNKLKDLVWVKRDLTFGAKIHSHMFYKLLPKLLYRERFDNISGAIQRLTEELITEWVKRCIKNTGVSHLACGGGVFMNVKANQKILELPEVKSFFVMPSCGDESTAVGAAYWGYEELRKKNRNFPRIKPLSDFYLGPEFSEKEIFKSLTAKIRKKYKIEIPQDMEKKIAKLLSQGKIVARLDGRMEWGARALGNRSILAHPEKLEVIRTINDQIKSRDFWMPFAPAIMKERQDKYIVNPKKMWAPYMIITFDSTGEGREKFKAAMHQYDFTLRPQIVGKDWNPKYWKILNEFEKLTGIGGVLNTSFNLHGYPIVCSPKDALDVFRNSGLEHLAIGSFLVSKN